MNVEHRYDISYGKMCVPVYRVYAQDLSGVPAIPESSFSSRKNTLLAFEVDVEVFGDNFLPAYISGDNSNVVATDSMKNFILRQALEFEGATLEAFLALLGVRLLATYTQMQRLRLSARELPFAAVHVPDTGSQDQQPSSESNVLFRRSHGDLTTVTLDFIRDDRQAVISAHSCGRLNLELFKVTGSSFTHFVRDAYTTLPERVDRPLFIYLNVFWKYGDLADMVAADHKRYVPAEQVRDLIESVFHEFVSESIQHLVHEMGQRLLARFPQLAEISFEAQNRTRDPIAESASDSKVKVYSDPFPAYGLIRLTIARGVE